MFAHKKYTVTPLSPYAVDFTPADLAQLEESAIPLPLARLNVTRCDGETAGMMVGRGTQTRSLEGTLMASTGALVFGGALYREGEPFDGRWEECEIKPDAEFFYPPKVTGRVWKDMADKSGLAPDGIAAIEEMSRREFRAFRADFEKMQDRFIDDEKDYGKMWERWYNRYRVKYLDDNEEIRLWAAKILKTRKQKKYLSARAPGTIDWVTIPRPDEGTYRKIIGEPSMTDDDDERTVKFWRLVRDLKIPVTLTEGMKKALAAMASGVAAVSVPGVWMATYKRYPDAIKQLQEHVISPTLRWISPARLTIAFDSDEKRSTRQTVAQAIGRIAGALFRADMRDFAIATWPTGWGKGLDDVKANGRDVASIINKAMPFDLWSTQRWGKLSYPVAETLTAKDLANSKYIPSSWQFPKAKIVALKAPKGSGKTEAIARAIGAKEIVALVLSHRRSLNAANAERFLIDSLADITHWTGGQGHTSAHACIDSCYSKARTQFDPEAWAGATIVWDEFDQIVFAALNSETHIAKFRVEILDNLRRLLQAVMRSAKGRIILADADLSDRSLDFLQDLLGIDITPHLHIVEVDAPAATKRTAYSYETAKDWLAGLADAIAKDECVMVHTVGQRANSRYGSQGLETMFARLFPEKRILRVDSDTVSKSNSDAAGFLKSPATIAEDYDVVIATPVIETGVSIESERFDAVFAMSHGMQTANSFRQAVARVRSDVPRHFFVPKSTALGRIERGETSVNKLVSSVNEKADAAARHCVQFDTLRDRVEPQNPHRSLETWAKYAAGLNAEFRHFRDVITLGLASEGYDVRPAKVADDGTKEELSDLLDEAKEFNCDRDDELVTNAANFDREQYDKTRKSENISQDDKLACRKFKVGDTRGTEPEAVKPQHVRAYRDGITHRQRFHYLLLHQDISEDESRSRVESAYLAVTGKGMFAKDLASGYRELTFWLLRQIGFDRLLRELQPASEPFGAAAFDDLARQYRKYKANIDRMLNASLDPGDERLGVKLARKLLSRCGLKLATVQRASKRENREYLYAIVPAQCGWKASDGTPPPAFDSDDRRELFVAWAERDLERMTERQEHRDELAFERETVEMNCEAAGEPQPEPEVTPPAAVAVAVESPATAPPQSVPTSIDTIEIAPFTACHGWSDRLQQWVFGVWNAAKRQVVDTRAELHTVPWLAIDGQVFAV